MKLSFNQMVFLKFLIFSIVGKFINNFKQIFFTKYILLPKKGYKNH